MKASLGKVRSYVQLASIRRHCYVFRCDRGTRLTEEKWISSLLRSCITLEDCDSITSGTPQKRETVKVYARFVPSKVIVFIFCFLLQMLSFTYKMTNSYTTRSCENINYSNILYRIEAIYFIDVFYTLFISTLFYQVLNCVVKYYFSFY